MRVIFVALGFEQLAISLLAPVLRRAGHSVGLAFARFLFDDRVFLSVPPLARLFDDDDVLEQVLDFKPDVVCFSALTANYRWMLGVAQRVKDATGAVTVFGGVHPSAVPEVVLEEPAVDYVCVGEGEFALPMLLDALARGRRDEPVPNFISRDGRGGFVRGPRLPFFQELDSLPHYDKDLWRDHVDVGASYLTMSSRGCPYRCSFCFNNFFAKIPGPGGGSYVRQRSVDHFIAELSEAKRRYRIRYVDIEDDIFTLDTAWLKEFSARYRREIGVPFFCLSHPQFLDKEKVAALKEAGCDWIQIGVQSGDDGYKKAQLRRYESRAHVEKALTLLSGAGIRVKSDHIFGFPGEPLEAQETALELYARHNVGRVGTFWLAYVPGTEIVEAGLRQGAVTQAQVDQINRGFEVNFHSEATVSDPKLRRAYRAYEALFRLLPLFPRRLRPRLRPAHIAWIPPRLLTLLGLAGDALAAAWTGYPELRAYALYYAAGLRRHLTWKLRGGRRRRRGELSGPVADPAWPALFARASAEAR